MVYQTEECCDNAGVSEKARSSEANKVPLQALVVGLKMGPDRVRQGTATDLLTSLARFVYRR